MATIHHNTVKRADRLGLVLVEREGGGFIVTKEGTDTVYAEASTARDALDLALASLKPAKSPKAPKPAKSKKARKAAKKRKARRSSEDGEEGDDEELDDEDDSDAERSIVKRKYRQAYRPNGGNNGDTLAQKLTAYLTINEDGEKRLDKAKLREFAIANDCWVGAYSRLHPGQQRMNVGNRLRAKMRKDPKYKVVFPS